MYKLTRPEVAEKLNISTRSVDRYIRAWKLRSKKDWKIVYINNSDVEWLLSWTSWSKQEIIIPKVVIEEKSIVKKNSSKQQWSGTLDLIYKDLREDIHKKDELIQWLYQKLWKNDEELKNSITLIEYKKSQFLLNESKWHISKELELLKDSKDKLEKEVKKERNSNVLLLIFLFIMLAITLTVWITKI